MQDLINKILVVINECKDPINNTAARNIRDDMLDVLSRELYSIDRKEVESYAKNDSELQALSWFYTRFIFNKAIGSKDDVKRI